MLEGRIALLFEHLRKAGSAFDTAIIISKVSQYYFTGTMQDGILVLRKDGTLAYFVRRSYARAKMESPLGCILPMAAYRDMLQILPENLGSTYIETEIVPVAVLGRIRKYFSIGEIHPLDRIIAGIRAVKSEYELGIIAESGRQHRHLLENIVPQLLREGMSETDLTAELYCSMIKLGHHGLSRFSMFQIEMVVGQIGFGTNSMYPTCFDGPGGMKGMNPAVPIIGDRKRFLKRGDLVFVDAGYGVLGYHTDKTQVYSFGRKPAPEAAESHDACRGVLEKAAGMLAPGRLPSDIYQECMRDLPPCLSRNFMGYGEERVKFLGHGVGLYIDEAPVIVKGNSSPLQENMVIALEPKFAAEGIGTVGVEETYVIRKNGAACLTGGAREIITVPLK